MDEIYANMQDEMEKYQGTEDLGESEIQTFFVGKTVFLSGCTGFVGKCVLEKLLRSCKGIKTIYTLMRTKYDQSSEQRLTKFLNNALFAKVLNEDPDCAKKIKVIEGDLSKPGIGLSPEDRRLITENTNIIIHNGAVVIFDIRVSVALKTNVMGTKEMLELADECTNLEAFLYVSTAYSHCYNKYITEEFLPPPGDLKMIQDMIDADAVNGLTDAAVESMLGQWPNIYAFSKSSAESVVQKHSKTARYPCGVFKPAIVSSTYREPLRSWCGNSNGPVAPFIGIGLGIVHVLHLDGDPVLDFVPADMTANAAIAVTWDLAKNKEPKQEHVYNYSSSLANPLRMSTIQTKIYQHGVKYPSSNMAWHCYFFFAQSYTVFCIMHYLLHFIPILIYDFVQLLCFKKPKATSIFLKLDKHLPKLDQFMNGNWKIEMKEVFRLCDRMGPADHAIFNLDIRKLNWEDYLFFYWRGLKLYILGEPSDSAIPARKRHHMLVMVHRITVTVLALSFLYFVYSIFT